MRRSACTSASLCGRLSAAISKIDAKFQALMGPPAGRRLVRCGRTVVSHAMDFELPPEDHPTRTSVRDWLAAHPEPTGRQLAEAGYVVPHWPRPWGLDADPIEQLVIDDELRAANVRRPQNMIGI